MNEAWEIKESQDTVGKRRGRRFLWTLQTTGRRSKISGVHRIKEERSGRKKERQSWLERGKWLWGGLKVREDSRRAWRGLKMMRGRGGGRRQLLCKCVLTDIRANQYRQSLSLFQTRVMMSALIYIWEQNKKQAKQLIDWSTIIFSQFQQHPSQDHILWPKDSLINEALLVNDQQILNCADLMHSFVKSYLQLWKKLEDQCMFFI